MIMDILIDKAEEQGAAVSGPPVMVGSAVWRPPLLDALKARASL
jgi:hypothetical protein